MTPDDVTTALTAKFGEAAQHSPPDAWQIETDDNRLLVISTGDWLRIMAPVMPIAEAQPFLAKMLEANFDRTQEARYAFYEDVVWALVQCDFEHLTPPLFEQAIDTVLTLRSQGADIFFSEILEGQLTQIITAAKLQGHSLEDTMKTLDRLYSEGVMGEMGESEYQKNAMASWRRQLERLWPTVDVSQANR